VLPCVIYAQDRSDDAGYIKDQQLEMDGCVQLLLPAAGCYLYSSGRGEERSQTTLALALLLGGEEEEGLEEVKSYLLDGKGERVTSSLTYAE